jgi:LacI family transcriptional regulator
VRGLDGLSAASWIGSPDAWDALSTSLRSRPLTSAGARRIFAGIVFGKEPTITTIRELAQRSGVSVATVSRVLNGYPDVSEKTRKRVFKMAAELDYAPSAAARTLVTKRSHVIGTVLDTGDDHPDLQHPFFQEVLVALKRRLGAAGYDLLLYANDLRENGSGQSYLRRSRSHRVDGVILMGADTRDPDVQALARSGIPCVAVDLDLLGQRAGYVMSDNVRGSRAAVEHLAQLGHRRVGFIGGPTTTRPGADRLLGFRLGLDDHQLPYGNDRVLEGDFYADSGHKAMERLLGLPEPPTAVVAASDLMAAGAVRAAQEGGIRVPADVSIVGFDDIQLAALMHPALTTIRQDKAGLGHAAAEALVRMIDDPAAPPPVVALPVELVVRHSTAAPPPQS